MKGALKSTKIRKPGYNTSYFGTVTDLASRPVTTPTDRFTAERRATMDIKNAIIAAAVVIVFCAATCIAVWGPIFLVIYTGLGL